MIKTTIHRNIAFIVVKILIVERLARQTTVAFPSFHEKNDYKSDKVVHIVVFFCDSTKTAIVARVDIP